VTSWAVDPGGVYVAPQDVGAPQVLDAGAQAVLTAWVDRLVPGDAHWPPASATPAVGYIDAMLRRAPAVQPAVLAAVEALAAQGFPALGEDEQVAALQALEASERFGAIFRSVLEMTLEAYYRDPAVEAVVRERTGFDSRVAMVGTPLPPFDESRLQRVRALPPRYREPQA
jgi:gluconate 2-dehydrogenase subunit 3-like protein